MSESDLKEPTIYKFYSYFPGQTFTTTTSGVRKKLSCGGSFSGIWWSFVFGVRCLWHHNLMSFSCFQTNLLAKFVGIICIFFYIHSPYFMCQCTEYKLLALQVRISEENTLNTTTQQFITAKISGCALKQCSKTHSSMRNSYILLRNKWHCDNFLEFILLSCSSETIFIKFLWFLVFL